MDLPTDVFAFDMSRNTVLDFPYVPVVPFLFCPLSDKRVALSLPTGISVCDERLVCKVASRPAQTITSSPLGTRLVVIRRPGAAQIVVDTRTWKTIADISFSSLLERVIPGDDHFLSRPKMDGDFKMDDGRLVHLTGLGPIADVQFLDSTRLAVTEYIPSAVAVFSLDGKLLYVIKTEPGSEISLLRAPGAGRFAIVELGYTLWNRMFNFLDIDNGRRRNLSKVRIFETANGKEIAGCESVPPRGSRFVLSPNGHLLASEYEGHVRVVELP